MGVVVAFVCLNRRRKSAAWNKFDEGAAGQNCFLVAVGVSEEATWGGKLGSKFTLLPKL